MSTTTRGPRDRFAVIDGGDSAPPRRQRQPRPRVADRDRYEIRDGGYDRIVATDGRREWITNFVASIVEERVVDDGTNAATRWTVLDVSVEGGPPVRVVIPSTDLERRGWLVREIGHHAHMDAKQGTPARVRAAIEQTAGDYPVRHRYGHTGWRRIDGEWVYLTGGACIGVAGAVDGVEVELPPRLAFALPPPPDADEQRAAIRALLGLLDVAPDAVTVPLLAAVVRAPLGSVDFGLWIAGPTGAGKSELAALAQQAYGPTMNARALPDDWRSTANALEQRARAAADAIYVVDDWLPSERDADAKADRLLRALGNRSGRARMRRDMTAATVYSPRALVVSTGEDTPEGESLLARLVTVEIDRGALDWSKLTAAQHDAAAGRYTQALAGYVRWLAARFDDDPTTGGFRERRGRVEHWLAAAGDDDAAHPRKVRNAADLIASFETFLDYAVECGIVDDAQRSQFTERAFDALAAKARVSDDPGRPFLALLSQALVAGRCHFTTPAGRPPPNEMLWGWTPPSSLNDAKPRGPRVGWLSDDRVWLEPEEAYAAVSDLARKAGVPLLRPRTLWQQLGEAGLISREPSRGTWRVRRRVEGTTRAVIEFHVELLCPGDPAAERPFGQLIAGLDDTAGGGGVLDDLDSQEGAGRWRPDDPRRFM